MDPFFLLTRLPAPFLARCRVPRDLESVTTVGPEDPPREAGLTLASVDRVWRTFEALYRTGVHPAVQVCIRRHGHVVLNRALGHARGNAPEDPPDAPKALADTDTPFCLFSASKAITAMVIHKLDEMRIVHLEDRVCDFIPEFARHDKDRITIRHLLLHRAGIPNLPVDEIDLELLARPERVVEILCEAHPRTRPGRLLAYHAVTGGFVLGEVVKRATGHDIRTVLDREIVGPLGLRMSYGVPEEDAPRVARNAFTGPPVPPPVSTLLRRALGAGLREIVELSNDPRFLTAIVPAANVMANAREASAFFQCLLAEGILDGVRVFEPRTVRHATAEQSYWELDLTLAVPLRYGLGLMLGGDTISLFGWDNPNAFGHLGLSNIFCWADPDRALSVAILTSGKPILSLHAVRIVQMLFGINRVFRKVPVGHREAKPSAVPRAPAAGRKVRRATPGRGARRRR